MNKLNLKYVFFKNICKIYRFSGKLAKIRGKKIKINKIKDKELT